MAASAIRIFDHMSNIVTRDHIGIFGRMNAGKSTVMNLLTQQATSIVDATPGTTADIRSELCEIHGLGPVKLFDTAGYDEAGLLGDKKREKLLNCLDECDLVLLIIRPDAGLLKSEREFLETAVKKEKPVLVIYNAFNEYSATDIAKLENDWKELLTQPRIAIAATDAASRPVLLRFILDNYIPRHTVVDLLPEVKRDGFYVLNIPMDAETPGGRLLRPQAMVEEFLTRNWALPVLFRMDLAKARGDRSQEKTSEEARFRGLLQGFKTPPAMVITDSQALDVVSGLVPDDIPLTTFSVIMIRYVTRGRLEPFIKGTRAVDALKAGDSVLIAEACNHSRIGEDIGTVQIPKLLSKINPDIKIDHCFGREFPSEAELKKYSLIIHCGGCMIASQKMLARLRKLEASGVPLTNYGLLLAYLNNKSTFERVIRPFNQA